VQEFPHGFSGSPFETEFPASLMVYQNVRAKPETESISARYVQVRTSSALNRWLLFGRRDGPLVIIIVELAYPRA
jgi:hypothetical protein